MDKNKPISGELAGLLPALAQTMEGSIQALRQSSALAEVLIAKGVLKREELDAAMKTNAHLANNLREVLSKLAEDEN
jgi:hypothetical protein